MLRRRPEVMRRGAGVVGAVTRTAAVAGTAALVAKGVSESVNKSVQHPLVEHPTYQTQAEMDQMQARLQALQMQQAQQAQAAATQLPSEPSSQPVLLAQLRQLYQLKEEGMLTNEEFQTARSRLLASRKP